MIQNAPAAISATAATATLWVMARSAAAPARTRQASA
jgi:hypothetical protein